MIANEDPSFKELLQFIKTSSKFIIAGHKEPDGDCVGCQLALCSALKRLGKEAIACSAGPFKRTELRDYIEFFTDIPKDQDLIGTAGNFVGSTKVIIVDCTGKERTGDIQNFLNQFPCAIIDHHTAVNHPPSTPQEPVYVDADMPACTLIIYKLIKALGLELTEEEATLLFFGLCTDTGFFRFLTDNNAAAFEAAAEFVRCGANPKKIFNTISGGKSIKSRILTGQMLSRIESHFDGKLLTSCETLDEFNYFGIESRDSDSLNQLMLSVEGVEATVTIRQECADYCTVSLRSTDKINVAQIASSFEGGGHKNAAGLTMLGDISFVKQKILESFKNIFEC